jgi:hypothetical protein
VNFQKNIRTPSAEQIHASKRNAIIIHNDFLYIKKRNAEYR